MPPSMHEISQAATHRAEETRESRQARMEEETKREIARDLLQRMWSVVDKAKEQGEPEFAANWFMLHRESPNVDEGENHKFFARFRIPSSFEDVTPDRVKGSGMRSYRVEIMVILPGEDIRDKLPVYELAEINDTGVYVPGTAEGEGGWVTSREDQAYVDIDNVITTIERNLTAGSAEYSTDSA